MVFVTGDCHSDFGKFSSKNFPEQKKMTKDDYVIICGDFGGVWYPEVSEYHNKEEYWLDWLEKKSYTTLFVDGNHENFERLYQFSEQEWNGGQVHKLRPSVLHLMRGEVFLLNGKKFFTFGGASSHDIGDGIIIMDKEEKWKQIEKQYKRAGKNNYRVKDLTWWDRELPTKSELEHGWTNLEKNNYQADYIISHCCPRKIELNLLQKEHSLSERKYPPDILTEYFNQIAEKVSFQKWFFGHYHDDMQLSENYMLVYKQIIKIVS